jgi:TonB family protein
MLMRRSSSATIFLIWLCLECAVANTQTRGGATITYKEPGTRWNQSTDTPPLPVGGVAKFVSNLYYPPAFRHRSYLIQGSTMLVVRADASGRVTSVTFSPHLHPELEQIVIEAVHACQWKPARKHGVAIKGAVRIPITFSVTHT